MFLAFPSFLCCGRGRYQKTSHIRATRDLRSYCWPLLIWKVAHISSKVDEIVLDCANGEVNEGFD